MVILTRYPLIISFLLKADSEQSVDFDSKLILTLSPTRFNLIEQLIYIFI